MTGDGDDLSTAAAETFSPSGEAEITPHATAATAVDQAGRDDRAGRRRQTEPPPRKGFARNAAWLLVAEATGKVASLLFVIVVARELGAREYGAFAFAVAFVAPFYRLSAWGVDSTVISEVARDHRKVAEIFPAGLLLRAGFGFIALVAAITFAPLFISGHHNLTAFVILGSALLLDEMSQFLSALFRSFERMEFHALVIFSNRVLSVVFALVVLRLGGGLIAVCLTYFAGSLGAMAFGFFFLRRFLPRGTRLRPQRTVLRHMVRTGAPLGIASAVNMLAFRADTVILQAVKGTVAVAQYAVAYRFFDSLAFVGYNLGDTAMPRIARQGKGRDAARTFVLGSAAITAFYLPLALAYAFGGHWIVVTLFGGTYRPAAAALAWLGIAGLFYGVTYMARVGAIALGVRNQITWVAVIALTANLAMNAYAIPRYAGTGAGATTFLTEVIESALLIVVFLRANRSGASIRALLVPVAAAAVTGAVLVLAHLRDAEAIIAVALVYAASLAVGARVLIPDDAARIVNAARKRFKRSPAGR
jgi:O-antigen/teichoic acid export membrane protein